MSPSKTSQSTGEQKPPKSCLDEQMPSDCPDNPLLEFIDSVRDKPFKWGSHDCIHFTAACVGLQLGVNFKLPKYATYVGALRKSKSYNIVQTLDGLFTRVTALPTTGAIVAIPDPEDRTFGYAIGIVSYTHGVFVAKNGLEFKRLSGDELFWTITKEGN